MLLFGVTRLSLTLMHCPLSSLLGLARALLDALGVSGRVIVVALVFAFHLSHCGLIAA